MKAYLRIALGTALLIATTASPVMALEHLSLSGGKFEVFDDNDAWMVGAEYRGSHVWRGLRPVAGVFVNDDQGSYMYGGVGYDIYLNDNKNFVITPGTAIGYYGRGSSKNLGGGLEFRSGIEAAYQFDNQHRIGVALHHLSNASIFDHNPGTETVTVHYSIPVQLFEE